ncbi:NAD-dependent epimerase/dehydratase family protein, partial [bacterium]|nr:NAD-dependent epimerase/dehydratase family protein [bacterium]
PEAMALAVRRGLRVRDIRKPPAREELHFFSGKIERVRAFRVAILGTDSAIGKRTTAWVLVDALQDAGFAAALAGTGQTAWLQGADGSIVLDSLVNDFVSGEIEHLVWDIGERLDPDVIVLEGQGSLMNPAYPGGFELLAAGRPHAVVLQHAPARAEYDGFPGYALHPLPEQIRAVELISGRPVVAITVNHEGLHPDDVPAACAAISAETGLPAHDVLLEGAAPLVRSLAPALASAGFPRADRRIAS